MRVEVLREFACLAKSLNFSTAAQQCFISQSTLSKHIAALERELGVELFARDHHVVSLTVAGSKFYEDVLLVLSSYDQALDNLSHLKMGMGQALKVGYLYGATQTFFSRLYHDFSSRYPEIAVELFSLEHNDLLDALERDLVDLILTEEIGAIDEARYERCLIYRDGCCAVMPAGHPLASRTELSLADLAGETLLTASLSSSNYATLLDHAFKGQGIEIDLVPMFNNFSEIAARVGTGGAMTISPSHLALLCKTPNVAFVPLVDSGLTHNVSAIWKRGCASLAVRAFIDTLKGLDVGGGLGRVS